jgi:MtN3 and saliva related transmembrane protein
MDSAQLIGLAAGTLTTIAFVPQVVKTYQSKSAKGLSLAMFLIFCSGVVLWLIYGIAINELPVIIANSVTLVLASLLLIFKLTFKD